jgi:hypothetical protein
MFKIATLNKISPKGLAKLDAAKYAVIDELDAADGILVRSYKMHDMEFAPSLKAIARAGAGVNNIPLDRAAEQDIIVKSGAWYSYKGQRIGQGRDNARKYLEDNPEVFDEIEKILREEFLNGEAVPVDVEAMNDTDEEGISLSAAVEGDDDLDLDGEF